MNPKRTFDSYLQPAMIPVDVVSIVEAHIAMTVSLGQLVSVYKRQVQELVAIAKLQEDTIKANNAKLESMAKELAQARESEKLKSEALVVAQTTCDSLQAELRVIRDQLKAERKQHSDLLIRFESMVDKS